MSDTRLGVIVALTPLAEDAVEHVLFDPQAPFEICASVAEADELEREAERGDATAILLSPDLSGLTPGHCARLRARGLRLVGLALDSAREQRLAALGVDATADPDASAETLATALRGEDEQPRPDPVADETVAVRPPARAARRGGAETNGSPSARRGSVLAVVGGKGAPGASECAASLAALANERWQTVLVELDALGGGLDVRLGADSHQGSLLGLTRAAENDRAGAELLERWLVTRPGWPPVLLAPPDLSSALAELARPGAITAALRALAATAPLVVCDLGWLLAEGGEVTLPARIHREALVAADAVLLVLGVRDAQLPHGLSQLDLLLGELQIPAERLRVAANGLGGPGVSARGGLTETLAQRLAERELALDAILPWDGRALARASSQGLPLAVARRRGAYARTLFGLLDELFLPTAPTPRKRKLRLAAPSASAVPEEVPLPWRS